MTAPTIKTAPRHRRRQNRAGRIAHAINWTSFVIFNIAATAALIYGHNFGLIAELADHLRRSLGGF